MTGEYLLDMKGVEEKVNASATWIREQMALGKFPLSIQIDNIVRWRGADIDAWILDQASKPRTTPAGPVRVRRAS
jgi:predicted DNA-binding transcriptional regulator AlpA